MVKRFHCGPRRAERRLFGAPRARRTSPASPTCSKRRTAATSAATRTSPTPSRLTAGLGTTWETLNVGYKPHASVTSIHTRARRARRDHARERAHRRRHRARRGGPEPDDPRALRLGIQGAGRDRGADEPVLRPRGDRARRRGFTEQYRESRLRDPRILDFIEPHRAPTSIPRSRRWARAFRHAARVKVTHARRPRVREAAAAPARQPGESAQPDEIDDKFRARRAPCIDKRRGSIVSSSIARERPDLTELTELIAAPVT